MRLARPAPLIFFFDAIPIHVLVMRRVVAALELGNWLVVAWQRDVWRSLAADPLRWFLAFERAFAELRRAPGLIAAVVVGAADVGARGASEREYEG